MCCVLGPVACSGPPDKPSEQTESVTGPEADPREQPPVVEGAPDSRTARSPSPPPSKSDDALIDVAALSGITFRHFNGTTGEFFLPEITGSGGAVFDYDNDGDLDLYLVQGAKLKPNEQPPGFRWAGKGPPRDRLYRNDLDPVTGAFRFVDMTDTSGIEGFGYGMGVATGDYNNDGWVDLYVTNLGSNQLLRNNGDGTFTNVAKSGHADDPRWSTSAAFVDYDRDGWLDLFVANYVDFSAEVKRECFAKSSARDYCGPDAYDALPDRLFHNRGDGTFEDVTGPLGFNQAFGAGLGVVAADLNGDDWIDIYVANDGDPNNLWINPGGKGRFQDDALLAGVALNQAGRAEAGMGVDAGDFDGDGNEDLFLAHLDGESNTLYVKTEQGFFEDRTVRHDLHAPSMPWTGFGAGFLDYDNDGRLDIFVANGAVRLQERQARRGERYPLQQRNQLFRGVDQGFDEVTSKVGVAMRVEEVSRGAIFGDIDSDGDTDIIVTNNNGPTRVLVNTIGSLQNWIGLRLLSEDGRDAHHARVDLGAAENQTVSRWVRTEGSYCSARDPRLIVGLGKQTHPLQVRVRWSDGSVDEWSDVPANRYSTLKQGASR